MLLAILATGLAVFIMGACFGWRAARNDAEDRGPPD